LFEIVFLGTSASAPSVHRGLTSQVVMHAEHRFLIDAGEGTQRQILKSGLGFKRLDRILVTHGHLDHILGIGGLLSTFVRWETMDEIEIVGGKAALERVRDLVFGVVLRGKYPDVEIRFRAIEGGPVYDEKDFTVSAFPVNHRAPGCYGFLFQEKARRPFLPGKAELLDIPPGPWRQDLVDGEEVTLPDGTKLVHVGDTGTVDDLYEVVRDADALIIEATYLESEQELAERFGHLTAFQAATLARDAGVEHLILTHISRRYHEQELLEEARAVFPRVEVARDFDRFRVKRGEIKKV